MAPQSQVVVLILTGIISSIIGYIQLSDLSTASVNTSCQKCGRETSQHKASAKHDLKGFWLDVDEQMLGGLVLSTRLLSLSNRGRIFE